MDGNKLEELRELVDFLKANEIAEFDMEHADLKVRIKFAGDLQRCWPRSGAVEPLDGVCACGSSSGCRLAAASAAPPPQLRRLKRLCTR